MRRKARVKGWLLNGYGLFEGGMAIARSEEAIFRGLEMTYMKPWERDVTFRTGLEAVKPWELAGVTS
jgi:DNA polymerase/3'-5' exonuclease PolX